MEIHKETEEKVIRMDIQFTEEEYSNLMEHADNYMPFEERERLKMEWALEDVIKIALYEAG